MKIFDFNHPSHRPLGIRLAVVIGCLGWAFWEYTNDQTGWAIFFGLIGVLSLWGLFINFNPRDREEEENTDG